MSVYSEKARLALEMSAEIAKKYGSRHVGTEHLLLSLACQTDSVASRILKNRNVRADNITGAITDMFPPAATRNEAMEPKISPKLFKVIDTAKKEADRSTDGRLGTEHLLLSLLLEGEGAATHILGSIGVLPRELLSDLTGLSDSPEKDYTENGEEDFFPDSDEFISEEESLRDMTGLAKTGAYDDIVGREKDISRIMQILLRSTKNNPLIIGEPGVGKTAVVEGTAARIASGRCPDALRGKRIYSLDITSVVAGTKFRGDFEDRLKNVLDELLMRNDSILFIDDMHMIVGAGNPEGGVDAANIIKPYLTLPGLQIIGAANISDYRRYIEKDPSLGRRFQPVRIDEPSVEETLQILQGLRDKLEAHHMVILPDKVVSEAVRLSARYVNESRLPDKAIDLLDEACASVRMKAGGGTEAGRQRVLEELRIKRDAAADRKDFAEIARLRKLQESAEEPELSDIENEVPEVTVDDIATVISGWTGIPVSRIGAEEAGKLASLEDELKKRIIGQDQAVKAVSASIKRNRTGLGDPDRPVGTFVFLGPTGVGKTELAKALAGTLFDSDSEMIRLDMSEFMEKHSASKLIGSPPGYVGYEEGGQLTERVRRKPYSVVLFDEIEKAHPDIFNVLLQILEDGMLTDSHGIRTDFRNTIIIMTSNVGARRITEPRSLGFAVSDSTEHRFEEMKNNVLEELKTTFRPEFLNRIDDIIVFRPLDSESMYEITGLMLKKLSERVKTSGFELEFDESIKKYIAVKGFDPKYGARPLRRAVTEIIENPLAEKIIRGEIKASGTIFAGIDQNSEVNFRQGVAD